MCELTVLKKVNYGEPHQIKKEVLAWRFVMPTPFDSEFLEFEEIFVSRKPLAGRVVQKVCGGEENRKLLLLIIKSVVCQLHKKAK